MLPIFPFTLLRDFKYSLGIVKRWGMQEGIHKRNNFLTPACKRTETGPSGQNSGSPGIIICGGTKELISEAVNCSPFSHSFFLISCLQWHTSKAAIPLCVPPARGGECQLYRLTLSPTLCILAQTHLAHLTLLLETPASAWESRHRLHQASRLRTTHLTPLPPASLLKLSAGPREPLDHSGYSELYHEVYLGLQHHQVVSELRFFDWHFNEDYIMQLCGSLGAGYLHAEFICLLPPAKIFGLTVLWLRLRSGSLANASWTRSCATTGTKSRTSIFFWGFLKTSCYGKQSFNASKNSFKIPSWWGISSAYILLPVSILQIL